MASTRDGSTEPHRRLAPRLTPPIARASTAATPGEHRTMGHVLLQAAATAPHRLDPWQLILHASPVVKLVMFVLAGMSVVCWFAIGTKLVRLLQAQRQSARFLDVFWSKDEGNLWTPERL